MNTKALYWIALGAFALALNSEYRDGGLPLAHRVADRATAIYCKVAARAEQTVEMARLVINGSGRELPTDEFVARQQAEMDRAMAQHEAEINRALALRQADLNRAMGLRQAELARMQENLGRVQVVMDRVQVQKLRKLGNFKFNFSDGHARKTILVCPETGAKIAINADPDSADIDIDTDVQ
jgi:hypothetical protein